MSAKLTTILAKDFRGFLELDPVPVGSRITCDPPVMNTDIDYLLLVRDDKWGAFREHLDYIWSLDGSDIHPSQDITAAEDRFQSYSYGSVNLIITLSRAFYDRFLAATSVAKRFNLLGKADRIALFQAVLYGRGVAE